MREVIDGYTVVLTSRADGHPFIAYVEQAQLPGSRAFFDKRKDAEVARKRIKERVGIAGKVRKIRVRLDVET